MANLDLKKCNISKDQTEVTCHLIV